MVNKDYSQVVLNVQAKDFVIKCGKDFAKVLESEIALISNGSNKLELATLVNAFVKLSFDNYRLQKELKKLANSINNELTKACEKPSP